MTSPALVLRLNDLAVAARDRLVAALAEHDLLAIHEDDLADARVWTAHFASAGGRDSAAAALGGDEDFASVGIRSTDVDDEDWARRTQADLPAVRIGNVIVAPPWDLAHPAPSAPSASSAPSAPSCTLVVIEPSRGFGTGHHQSTRLCLALLQSRSLSGRTMIDVGTGSGVLAITAAKLGAAYVVAIDIDPEAVANARENIATNGVSAVVEAHMEDFTTARLAEAPPRQQADVVTANLTGVILARHAGELASLVRTGGALIVSGFTVEEKGIVAEAFAPDLDVTESAEEDGWLAFVLARAT